MGNGFSSQVNSKKTKKLHIAPGKVQIGYWKKVLAIRSSDAVAQLYGKVLGSLSLEVLNKHGDVAVRDVI